MNHKNDHKDFLSCLFNESFDSFSSVERGTSSDMVVGSIPKKSKNWSNVYVQNTENCFVSQVLQWKCKCDHVY